MSFEALMTNEERSLPSHTKVLYSRWVGDLWSNRKISVIHELLSNCANITLLCFDDVFSELSIAYPEIKIKVVSRTNTTDFLESDFDSNAYALICTLYEFYNLRAKDRTVLASCLFVCLVGYPNLQIGISDNIVSDDVCSSFRELIFEHRRSSSTLISLSLTPKVPLLENAYRDAVINIFGIRSSSPRGHLKCEDRSVKISDDSDEEVVSFDISLGKANGICCFELDVDFDSDNSLLFNIFSLSPALDFGVVAYVDEEVRVLPYGLIGQYSVVKKIGKNLVIKIWSYVNSDDVVIKIFPAWNSNCTTYCDVRKRGSLTLSRIGFLRII
jgi:hypothetical protein